MSCKSRVFSACLLAGEALPFQFNWTRELANLWAADTGFAALAVVRPRAAERQTGFEYASSGGQTGPEEPQWPTTLGGTVQDGSITWTAQALSNGSLRERIADVDWPAVTDFTITPALFVDEPGRQLSAAQISSALVIPERRPIRCEMTTTAGNDYVGIIRMKVE